MSQNRRIDQISEALSDGCPSSPEFLMVGFDGVLAVDSWNGWSAAFCMRIAADGSWSSDIHFLRQDDSGVWEDCGSGGADGTSWPPGGWRPSVEEHSLAPGHRQGIGVADEDGDDLFLAAVAGYAGSSVHAIAVEADDVSQVTAVQPRLSAFVVIRPERVWTLRPLDGEGRALGEPQVIKPFP